MTYSIKPDREHLIIYINGRFYCTVDDWKEVEEELQNYVEEREVT